jgi:DNA-directed RNA polymerase subunit RPC12/RpoP
MPVVFRCASCERTLSTARRKTGQEITCPACFSPVLVEPIETIDTGTRTDVELPGRQTTVRIVGSSSTTMLAPPRQRVDRTGSKKGLRVFVSDDVALEPIEPPRHLRARLFAWTMALAILSAAGLVIYLRFQ